MKNYLGSAPRKPTSQRVATLTTNNTTALATGNRMPLRITVLISDRATGDYGVIWRRQLGSELRTATKGSLCDSGQHQIQFGPSNQRIHFSLHPSDRTAWQGILRNIQRSLATKWIEGSPPLCGGGANCHQVLWEETCASARQWQLSFGLWGAPS